MMVGIKSGDVFRLLADIMSIHSRDGRMVALAIPNGSFIEVVAHPCEQHKRMTEVLCDELPICVFSMDIKERALQLSITAEHSAAESGDCQASAETAGVDTGRQTDAPGGLATGAFAHNPMISEQTDTLLCVVAGPACPDCDDKRASVRNRESSSCESGVQALSAAAVKNSCGECDALNAAYEDSLANLDWRVRGLRGVLGQSVYQERKCRIDEARRNVENARAALEQHRCAPHAMSANN